MRLQFQWSKVATAIGPSAAFRGQKTTGTDGCLSIYYNLIHEKLISLVLNPAMHMPIITKHLIA
jgi:hypothetical protein